ncbi:hypothetical protein TRFO_41852 [Tritrichomonas foetus]|uniref:Uncharacterized protein n=1 Tax=Tritrichomonas foetus TaxID=1144522 RepID=A0A1J4L351_9EUKA|nr:hypothetical protein TRFO_41852 [Tritrichomonas foetus]|eukprot:OHT16341.1 hypothetical protein TRFO_41852 [Tritrichomonas foetus]
MLDEDSLLEPCNLNHLVMEAYNNSVRNAEYSALLSELPSYQNSQDFFFNALSFPNLSEPTIIYILSSLARIFNERKPLVNQYSSLFMNFFIHNFPFLVKQYKNSHAIINSSTNLFIIAFRECRQLAKTVLLNIKDKFLVGILVSNYVYVTKSIDCFSSFFEAIVNPFQTLNQNQNHMCSAIQPSLQFSSTVTSKTISMNYSREGEIDISNFVLFSIVLSSFNRKYLPSQLIEMIIQVGGPKTILLPVKMMELNDACSYLKSLQVIINLPATYFKREPVRLKYLIDFIESSTELLISSNELLLKKYLMKILVELRNCPSIRSLNNPQFLITWLNQIHIVTKILLNTEFNDFFGQHPDFIEDLVCFWSLTFDFQMFHENGDFKAFVLRQISDIFQCTNSFLILHSKEICEYFIQDNSSNFFEYLGKTYRFCYKEAISFILLNHSVYIKQFDNISILICLIELSSNLIKSHSNMAEYMSYYEEDLKLVQLIGLILNIHPLNYFDVNEMLEISLNSFFAAFLNTYHNRVSNAIDAMFNKHSDIFILFVIRSLQILNIKDEKITCYTKRHIAQSLNFQVLPESVISKLLENEEFISIVVNIDINFCFEKETKNEAKNLYSNIFSILKSKNSLLEKTYEIIFNKMTSSIELVPFCLNIFEISFDLPNQLSFISYRFLFDHFFPFLMNSIKDMHLYSLPRTTTSKIPSQMLFTYNESVYSQFLHATVKFLSFIASSNELKRPFKFMSDKIIMLFKKSLALLKIVLECSGYDETTINHTFHTLNSFLRNNSLNIGIMILFNDQSFTSFVNTLFANMKDNEYSFKILPNILSFFDLYVTFFTFNEVFNVEVFHYFIQLVINKFSSMSRKDALQCSLIINKSHEIMNSLKQNSPEILEKFFSAVVEFLLSWKGKLDEFSIFYMNMFCFMPDRVNNLIIPSLFYLPEDKKLFIETVLNELFHSNFSSISSTKQFKSKFLLSLRYIRESLVNSSFVL